MSKTSKAKNSARRREEKKRRKLANYIRTGPKTTNKSKKKTGYGTHKTKTSSLGKDLSPTPPSSTGRRRHKGLAMPAANKRTKSLRAKLPLAPLRVRRQLSSSPADHGH